MVIGEAFDRGGKDGITGWIGPQVRVVERGKKRGGTSLAKTQVSLFSPHPVINPSFYRAKLVPMECLVLMEPATELTDTVRRRYSAIFVPSAFLRDPTPLFILPFSDLLLAQTDGRSGESGIRGIGGIIGTFAFSVWP